MFLLEDNIEGSRHYKAIARKNRAMS